MLLIAGRGAAVPSDEESDDSDDWSQGDPGGRRRDGPDNRPAYERLEEIRSVAAAALGKQQLGKVSSQTAVSRNLERRFSRGPWAA